MKPSPTLSPRRIAVALATLATAALFAAAPAHAADATAALCTNRSPSTITITPGFSLAPSSGTITTNGQTGSITCIGKIAGHSVTGPGSIGIEEAYADGTCTSHTGSGTVSVTIPTTAGIQHLSGALTERRTALVLRADVQFPGGHFSGIGIVLPTVGNCFVTPLRQALLSVTGWLRGA
jgi:hypothetical protein